jgi:hypothetical protein
MAKQKMGGKKTLRILLKGNADLADSLLSRRQGGQVLDQGLSDLIAQKYRGACTAEIVHESGEHSGILLQQLGQSAVPDEVSRPAAPLAAPVTRLFDAPADVVVLAVEPDVFVVPWRHRSSGYLVHPPVGWQEVWTAEQRQWFAERFEETTPLAPPQFKENWTQLIRGLKERLDAHVLVLNCSPLDPREHTHDYHGRPDTPAVRIQRYNLALIELSMQEGISIIDVHRLIAELGGERHVKGYGRYSAEAHSAISRESLRVLEDIGFFEPRPLVLQIGQKGK